MLVEHGPGAGATGAQFLVEIDQLTGLADHGVEVHVRMFGDHSAEPEVRDPKTTPLPTPTSAGAGTASVLLPSTSVTLGRVDAAGPRQEPGDPRRAYLTIKALEGGYWDLVSVCVAIEAVASTALEHPEWDMGKSGAPGRTWERADARRSLSSQVRVSSSGREASSLQRARKDCSGRKEAK
jgi:hypothetical protein